MRPVKELRPTLTFSESAYLDSGDAFLDKKFRQNKGVSLASYSNMCIKGAFGDASLDTRDIRDFSQGWGSTHKGGKSIPHILLEKEKKLYY